MENETTKSMWRKPASELSVSESLQIQGVVLAVMAGVTVVGCGVIALAGKLQERKNRRKPELKIVEDVNAS